MFARGDSYADDDGLNGFICQRPVWIQFDFDLVDCGAVHQMHWTSSATPVLKAETSLRLQPRSSLRR